MRGMTSLVAAVAVGLVSLAASAVKVEVVKVHSDAMGKDVPLSVILPDAYGKDSGRQFPVVYAQHSAFWLSHPELRRVPHSSSWVSAALDYAHPEVRAYILGFIREALEQYDMDGLTGDKFHLSLISLTYHTTQLKKGQHYEHMA